MIPDILNFIPGMVRCSGSVFFLAVNRIRTNHHVFILQSFQTQCVQVREEIYMNDTAVTSVNNVPQIS
jgi:hypothetical protein